MGLAASQARFLGITLRKANCEFQSTQLAEQRLRISNQLSDISQEYSNAMNATTLMWCNDIAEADYGLTYSLLMMPSALNDYNPYFVSTKSGAIVLNSNYADAAKAAGISMGGSVPSSSQRNAFIEALAGTKDSTNSVTGNTYSMDIGMATSETVDRILKGLTSTGSTSIVAAPIKWNRTAGMGAATEDKGAARASYLSDVIMDDDIGGMYLDWLQMFARDGMATDGSEEIDEIVNNSIVDPLKDAEQALEVARQTYLNNPHGSETTFETVKERVLGSNSHLGGSQFKKSGVVPVWEDPYTELFDIYVNDESADGNVNHQLGRVNTSEDWNQFYKYDSCNVIIDRFAYLEFQIEQGNNLSQNTNQLDNLKQGKDPNGRSYKESELYPVLWAMYQDLKAQKTAAASTTASTTSTTSTTTSTADYGKKLEWGTSTSINLAELNNRNSTTQITTSTSDNSYTIKMDDLFQLGSREIENKNSSYGFQYTVIRNGIIDISESDLQKMTIADLLTNDIVIMNWQQDGGKDCGAIDEMSYRAGKLMDYIASVFGYGNIGVGLNIDSSTDEALSKALNMVKSKFLKTGNAIITGSDWDKKNPSKCSPYENAENYNRIGADKDQNTAAVNLSNMVSAFLTYYDNFLRGTDSEYYVGKANDDSNGQKKTYFVTDDPSYTFITTDPDQIPEAQKVAEFYDELYNNICAKGWRLDDSVDQYDYLESTIKDGRYQLMSLNSDGYFYQTRYNDIDFIQEVKNEDARTRAEADYTQKKAELTYKEDTIDMKSKKLDAEIAELNTEISSVQNMISKSIEKTFAMFSS